MKKLMLLLFMACAVSLSASAILIQSVSKVHLPLLSVTDSTKKMSAKKWKEVEKQLKNTMPKQMAITMLKQLKEAEKLGKSTLVADQKMLTNMMMESFNDNADQMNYEIKKKEIIDDFKQEEFDSSTEKREARKEMRQELRELKKEYKEDQKKKRKEKKAENLQFI